MADSSTAGTAASWTTALNEPGVSPSAVSCSTPASCVTVGGGPSNSLSSAVLVDGTWVAESVPDPGSDGFLYDVSCASPTFCMAVGSIQVNGAGWASGLTEAWDGASWLVVPSPNYPEDDLGPGFIGGGILISDSCVSAQACVAVGYGGGGVNSSSLSYPILAVVETWDGDAWSLTPTPAPVEPAGGGRADLRGVSCVPDANDARCVAAGLQTPTTRPSRLSSRQPLRRSDPSMPRRRRFNRTARVISPQPSPQARRAGLRSAGHGGGRSDAHRERHLPERRRADPELSALGARLGTGQLFGRRRCHGTDNGRLFG